MSMVIESNLFKCNIFRIQKENIKSLFQEQFSLFLVALADISIVKKNKVAPLKYQLLISNVKLTSVTKIVHVNFIF